MSEQPGNIDPVNTTPETPAAKPNRVKGFLKCAFNFAVKAGIGAAVSATLKTAAVVGAGVAGAPAWMTIVAAGLAVGAGSVLVRDAFERRSLKKKGEQLAPYFSKAHGKQIFSKKGLKTFAFSAVASMAGSALFMGFHDGVIQGWWNHLTGHSPEAVVPPAVPLTPAADVPAIDHNVVVAPIPCPTPLEQFESLTQGHHISKAVEETLQRVHSTNPRVHAQALKDLAYYAQNGFDGVPKDHNVALQLFKEAADAGNLQGQVDMVYLQYHGLDGIPADKNAAIATMKELALHNQRGAELLKAWVGNSDNITPVPFNSNTIVQGMKLGC